MNRGWRWGLWLIAAGALAGAQQRDFLTGPEVELVREAQEPNDRIKLYVGFAKARLDRVEKELGAKSERRGLAIHDLLEDYSRIVDTIDDYTGYHLGKRALLRRALVVAVRDQPDLLKRLKALEARNPEDLDDFRFVLRQAIETTESSMEELKEALRKQPEDKRLEKEIEKEAKKEEKRRKENEKPPR